VPALEKFQGEVWKWKIAESPLIVDDKVIFTPGGQLTSMVALNKNTGKTIWQTTSLGNPTAFVSPIVVELGDKKIIINVLTEYIFGVDAKNGTILWKVKYSDIEAPKQHEWAPKNNCVTPLYHDGQLFVTSGYDHVGVMFKLVNQGAGIQQLWINSDLDNHHGQVVRVGSQIYGSNWINNREGNWCCVDWKTGKTLYEESWHTKGPISAADNMLYCYDEKDGNLALVNADPHEFKVSGSLQITHGSGPHWTQPVIKNGVLYIRHGDALVAYKVSQ
jgi:outer membrane protein assembly factor BamB